MKKQDGTARGGFAGVVSLRFVTPVGREDAFVASSKIRKARRGRRKSSPEDRYSVRVEVGLQPRQAKRIDRKRGRLSRSAFMRERSLHEDSYYEPTISAIGSLYQLCGQLNRRLPEIARTMEALVRLETNMLHALRTADPASTELADAARELSAACRAILSGWEPLVNSTATLEQLTREMATTHLQALHVRDGDTPIRKRRG